MKKIIAYIMSVLMGTSGTCGVNTTTESDFVENPKLSVFVDRLEDNNYVVLEVGYNEYYNIVDVKQDDFNTYKRAGDRIKATTINGKFDGCGEWFKGDDFSEKEIYYQFKSNDNSVWWMLTAEDMGFIPEKDIEYTLIYFDNGTTAENKSCECLQEWECECEVYDDILLGIVKK